MADVTRYLNLVTSEHADKPNFLSVITALVQPFADQQIVLESMPSAFDLDTAVAAQLDDVGLWIGQSRYLTIPLENVYFSFDVVGLGLDEGNWKGPYDPETGLVALNDDDYRTLLRAKIAANHWDGSIPSAYRFLDDVFGGNTPIIQDNGDMSMYLGVIGPYILTAVTLSLLKNGYLDVKPAGVRISGYVTASVLGTPLFGTDAETSTIGGLDVGAWATISGGM
jgi:hypothetical protein